LRQKLSVFKIGTLLILCVFISFAQNSDILINFRDSLGRGRGNGDAEQYLLSSQVPVNDTTPPVITFIQPNSTNELVAIKTYYIIINITDNNSPIQGDVIIQVSSHSNFLFNASMILIGYSQWRFSWINLTSYPNQENYTLKVWAKDSSPNGNTVWSEEYSIFVNIQNSLGILQLAIYIIIASTIFACILVYINKKGIIKSVKRN